MVTPRSSNRLELVRPPKIVWGNSGMGKYYGKAGFDALSNAKSILVGNPELPLDVFPPYGQKDIENMLSIFG